MGLLSKRYISFSFIVNTKLFLCKDRAVLWCGGYEKSSKLNLDAISFSNSNKKSRLVLTKRDFIFINNCKLLQFKRFFRIVITQ
jgi:hypothetical protein